VYLFNDPVDWLVWSALVVLVAALLLLAFAIGGHDPGRQSDDTRDEPRGHKPPPNYTLDDWT
jgi:hypothetical protein